MKLRDKGQQEIAGFVLIVVLVMVALMIFLVISLRNSDSVEESSVGVSNMLDAIMKTTSECAIVYEPDYDDFEELFKSCYKGSSCKNLNRTACEYLDESLRDVVSSMVKSDALIEGWEVGFFVRDGEGILKWSEGRCVKDIKGAQRTIVSSGDSLIIQMRVCGG